MPDFSSLTWDDALREYLLHKRASFAPKTVRYHQVQLGGLAAWAAQESIPFVGFGKRHLDRYLVYRQEAGKAQTTLHHDAICAKTFFAWCAKNDLVDRSPLAEYQVRSAPRPPKHMPTHDEIVALLHSVHDYWDVRKNPDARFQSATKRAFHRDRNYAVILGLLDTACRIGEMLSFKVGDYQPSERRITIRESKGRKSRVLPVSPEWEAALTVWLKIRAKVMVPVPAEEDEGWLFISEFGTRMDEGRFLKSLKGYLEHGQLPDAITLHSLRRYSLNKLAKDAGLLVAQYIAGHTEPKTTLIYTSIDPEHVRAQHAKAAVVKGVVTNSRLEREKQRRLVCAIR